MTILIIKRSVRTPTATLLTIALLIFIGVSLSHHILTPMDRLPTVKPLEFKNEEVQAPFEVGTLRQKITIGVVEYSFVASLLKSGISQKEINLLLALIKSNFNIIDSVKRDDHFILRTKLNSRNETYISSFYYLGSKTDLFIINDGQGNIFDEHGVSIKNKLRFSDPFYKSYRVSSGYDLKRTHPVTNITTPHLGTDYATPVGTPIRSIADGIVLKSRYNRFAGNYINIRHTNGSVSRYLHLSQRNVHVGEKISRGQVIGKTGNTGRTTGPHLHLELHINGIPVDYERYIQKHPNTDVNIEMLIAARKEKAELMKEWNNYRVYNKP
ncbi:peptidase M23 [Vibrio sp. T9]|uniref:M23 family metallopeptidase n=1 Tax=Vibrio sp. T9 TaxID=2007196 RepID=UPI000D646142|nr:peptidoglycan DD-metalloendopeptidase family protein [Vibrio sp. T9]PWF73571.1 peptidase M23 [Vibrio sp. T9]